jgi:hypothetical protein
MCKGVVAVYKGGKIPWDQGDLNTVHTLVSCQVASIQCHKTGYQSDNCF